MPSMRVVFVAFAATFSVLCPPLPVCGENFPSLITTNATLAIVIDREYLAEDFDAIKTSIENYLVFAKREILKHGGVNVNYYTWTSINVKRDITAILSIASCKDTWKLFQSSLEENILHMAISETDCPRMPSDVAFAVPMVKNGEEMPQIILDLRTSDVLSKWLSVIIIYDSTLDRDMVTRVLTAVTKESSALRKNSAVALVKVDSTGTTTERRLAIKHALETINTKTMGSNFMPIVSKESMELVMDVARGMGLVTPLTQWLYVVSDTNHTKSNISSVKKMLSDGDNIAFAYNSTSGGASCLGGLQCHAEEILEAFCKGLEAAIVAEFELASQVSDEEWEAIRPSKQDRRNSLLASVKSFLLQYGTCDNCTNWKFQASETWGREFLTSSKKQQSDPIINVGTWRPSDGASMQDVLFPHVAHGFRGRKLPLVTFHNPPWQIIKTTDAGDTEHSGIVFDIIRVLAASLNFTYSIEILQIAKKSARNQSSIYSFNQSLEAASENLELSDISTHIIPDRVVQMIQNRQAAISAAAFSITENNKQIVNFTMSISTQPYTFLVARPKELGRALLFMSPFNKDTWLCLAACVIAMGPVLWFVHKFSPVYDYTGISKAGGLSSIENCIWFMYGALLQQGGMHLPAADSARIIVGSWWLVVLVVATTYCGNLVAFLTFPKIDSPISTIDNLLEMRDTISWSVSPGSYLFSQLKISKEPKYRTLYTGGNALDLHTGQMLPMIQDGRHVFIDWKMRLMYVMRRNYLVTDKCDLALGTDEFFEERIALIVAPGSPYLPRINEEIKRLHQNGLIDKWLKQYMPKKDKCFKVRSVAEANNHTVNMDDMQGSFFVLFFGFILAMIWIIGEKLWYKYGRKRNAKVIQPYST